MWQEFVERPFPISLPERIVPGVEALWEASIYADDVESDPWEFAVSIRHLEKLGITASDLRWLVRKGFVDHAKEVTVEGDNGRNFRPTGDITFCKSTCVILTKSGVAACQQREAALLLDRSLSKIHDQPSSLYVPSWDLDSRRLHLNGVLVKSFKWRAANQEAVLAAFQEDGWPPRIDDPLPPHPEQDAKRRLSDTIKCLNHKQVNGLIRFHGDGTGEGVVWEQLCPN